MSHVSFKVYMSCLLNTPLTFLFSYFHAEDARSHYILRKTFPEYCCLYKHRHRDKKYLECSIKIMWGRGLMKKQWMLCIFPPSITHLHLLPHSFPWLTSTCTKTPLPVVFDWAKVPGHCPKHSPGSPGLTGQCRDCSPSTGHGSVHECVLWLSVCISMSGEWVTRYQGRGRSGKQSRGSFHGAIDSRWYSDKKYDLKGKKMRPGGLWVGREKRSQAGQCIVPCMSRTQSCLHVSNQTNILHFKYESSLSFVSTIDSINIPHLYKWTC